MRDGPKGMTCSSAARGSLGILCETKFGNLAVREIVVVGVRYRLVSQFKSLFFNSSLFVNISTQQEHINCKFVVEVPRNTVQREVPRQLGNCYEPQSQEFQQPLFDYWSVRLGQMWDRFGSQTAKVKVATMFSALHVQKMAAAPLFLRKWHARQRGMWSILGLEQRVLWGSTSVEFR